MDPRVSDILLDRPNVISVARFGKGLFEVLFTDEADSSDFDAMRSIVGNRPLRLMEPYPMAPNGAPQWRMIFGAR